MTGKTVRDHTVQGLAFRSFSSPHRGGAVFVLIHGIGMSHRYLTRLHDELPRDAEVHTIDLPGFGGLPKPARAADIADVATALGVVLDALGVRDAVLIGHSMGAQWVVELGVQRPDLARAVVTIGPVTDDERRNVLAQALLLGRDSLREPLRGNALVFSDYLRCGPVWYLRQARHMLSYPIEERVELLAAPLLVVRGGDDPIARQAWAERLSARAAEGAVAVVPGHRHLAQLTAAPEVAAHVRAFLSRTGGGPGRNRQLSWTTAVSSGRRSRAR